MSDMGDDFRAMRDARRENRAKNGRPCEECIRLLPKAHPSILLPGQRCRIHPSYQAPRPPSGPESRRG